MSTADVIEPEEPTEPYVEQGGYTYLNALDAADLPSMAHHLGYYLQARARGKAQVRPTPVALIMRAMKVSRPTAMKHLKVLVQCGFLKIERPPRSRQRATHETNRLVLCVPVRLLPQGAHHADAGARRLPLSVVVHIPVGGI